MILGLELAAAFVGGVLAAFVAAVKLGPWYLKRKMKQVISTRVVETWTPQDRAGGSST